MLPLNQARDPHILQTPKQKTSFFQSYEDFFFLILVTEQIGEGQAAEQGSQAGGYDLPAQGEGERGEP
jgi:hypothetical protein